MDERGLVGRNWGVRNMRDGERKNTREERKLSMRGTRVIQLGYQGNI